MLKKIVVMTTILNVFFLFGVTMYITHRTEIIISTANERIVKLKDNNELLFILHLHFDKSTSDLLLKNIAENEKNIKESEQIIREIETHRQDTIKNIVRAGKLNIIMVNTWKNQREMAEMLNKKVIEENKKQEKKEINARKTNRAFFLSKKPT